MFRKKTVQNKSSFNLFCFCHLRAAWQWVAGTDASVGVGATRFLHAQSHFLSTAQHLQKPRQSCIALSRIRIKIITLLNSGLELGFMFTALIYSWYIKCKILPLSWLCPSPAMDSPVVWVKPCYEPSFKWSCHWEFMVPQEVGKTNCHH